MRFNINFYDQNLQRRFEYGHVIKIIMEENGDITLFGFDNVFKGSEAFQVVVGSNEYTYFKVRKEVNDEN